MWAHAPGMPRQRELGSAFSDSLSRAAVWFYKKGCQGKKFPRELEAAKSFGIQPRAGASRRSSARVVWLKDARVVWLKDSEMFRCQGHRFANPPFPLMRKGFCRTARSGQGRAVWARGANP